VSGDGSPPGGKVAAGFFSFTQVTDETAHGEYNAWHQLDHLPEQMPLEGIAYGQRWVSTPACSAVTRYAAARREALADLSTAQYLTIYLMLPPVDASVKAFYDLARELHAKDRFFSHRRAIASGPLPVVAASAATRVSISAAAVPYRPNRGVYLVIGAVAGAGTVTGTGVGVEELLEVPGVAGVWSFAPVVGVSSAPAVTGETLEEEILVCYLDEDPVETAARIEEVVAPGWRGGPRLAGPFETITPWSWDWFGADRREADRREGDCREADSPKIEGPGERRR
jgi:hypothetical protein